MKRRDLLGLVLSASPFLSHAQSKPTPAKVVDVAKVMRFSCPFCLAAEAHDRLLVTEARKYGGKFVWAPVPDAANSLGARERVYYAARELGAGLDSRVKASLYKASQEAQVQLETYAQVYYWLEQDLPDDYDRFPRLFETAQSSSAGDALKRAIRLTINAGVEVLPTYVILSDGQIATTVDKGSAGADSQAALRDAVLSAIRNT